jgi:hypothetical protein
MPMSLEGVDDADTVPQRPMKGAYEAMLESDCRSGRTPSAARWRSAPGHRQDQRRAGRAVVVPLGQLEHHPPAGGAAVSNGPRDQNVRALDGFRTRSKVSPPTEPTELERP